MQANNADSSTSALKRDLSQASRHHHAQLGLGVNNEDFIECARDGRLLGLGREHRTCSTTATTSKAAARRGAAVPTR